MNQIVTLDIPNPWKFHLYNVVGNSSLGSGSFGSVWKAQHNIDHQFHAIKKVLIDKSLRRNQGNFEKIRREVQLPCEINSIHIVKYQTCWLEDLNGLIQEINTSEFLQQSFSSTCPETQFLFIVMELCDFTLLKWLEDNPDLETRSTSNVRQMLIQICSGLQAIHKRGIIHRDLKPDNIFCKIGNNSNNIWKLGDFGLSLKLENNQSSELSSHAGCRMYRSPEMDNLQKYDFKTDVFSLGLIFCEILYPFKNKNPRFFVDIQCGKYSEETKAILRSIESSHPMEFNIVIKMLTIDANDRLDADQLFNLLEVEKPSISTCSTGITFNISPPIWNFVGRVENIRQLQIYLENPNIFLVTVVGLGGIGKSELAKKLAEVNSKNINRIWLNGESPASLNQAIVQLAISILVPITTGNNQTRNILDIFEDILNQIKTINESKILLIIDNVDVTNTEVKSLLKKSREPCCFTIITSRHVGVSDFAGELINLDFLLPEDAIQFVNNSIKGEFNEDVNKFCERLQYFPLALQQAVAYIKMQKVTGLLGHFYKIQNYLSAFEIQKQNMLDFPLNLIEHDYSKTTWVTWKISIDQIKRNEKLGEEAIELLNIISYCEADGISVQLLYCLWFDQNIINQALVVLKSYSLIKAEQMKISIHRLVQEVVLINCTSSNLEVRLLKKICQSVYSVLETLKSSDMPHITSIWNHASQHDELIKEFSNLPDNIIDRLHGLSLYREMSHFSNGSHDRFVKVLGEEHLQTLIIEIQIARAYNWIGLFEESFEKYQVIYEKTKRVLGVEDKITLWAGHDMAVVLTHLNRLDEALQQYQTVLELKKKVLGENDRDTIATKHEIAGILRCQGKTTEALKIYKEVLEWYTINIGPEHPQTLTMKHNIGVCICAQKQLQKAKEIFQQVLELKVKVCGDEHSETLLTKYMLALTLDELGESEKALQIMNQVLTSRVKVLGKVHPQTLESKFYVAKILYDKSKFVEAKEILEETLQLWMKLCGEEHRDILMTKSWLGLTLDKLGESDKALELQRLVLAAQKKTLGPRHKDTIITQSRIDEITRRSSQRCVLQ